MARRENLPGQLDFDCLITPLTDKRKAAWKEVSKGVRRVRNLERKLRDIAQSIRYQKKNMEMGWRDRVIAKEKEYRSTEEKLRDTEKALASAKREYLNILKE